MSSALAIASVLPVSMSPKAAFGMTAPAHGGFEHPDRALFEAIAEWQSGHEEQERISGIHDQLEDLAGETEPPMPSELFEALEMPNEKLLPADMEVGWAESSLRALVKSGQRLQISSEKLPNDALRTNLWWDDIPQATIQRAAEILQVRLDYIEKVHAHWEKAEAAQDSFDDQVSKQFDKVMEVAEMPAQTVEGLAAKCQMLLDEPMIGDLIGDMGGEAGQIAKSLIADILTAVDRGALTV